MKRNLTLCICLLAALCLCACSGPSHNCEEPEIYKPYNLAAQGDTVYFTAYDKVYCHQPGDQKATQLAEFRGLFYETPHGVYCFDEYCADDSVPDLYLANGDELIPIGNIPEYAGILTILDVVDGTIYWSCGETAYQTDCTTGETEIIFSCPDIQRPQRIANGKIWFTAKGGIFQYYDMETGEIVTYCNSFWSYKAEPYTIFYFDDFILCHCIQYEPNEEGTHDVKGYWYYRLDYGSSDPVFLTEYTWYSTRPWLLDNTLYYFADMDNTSYLVSCDAVTGQITQLEERSGYNEEIAVTEQGFYYTEDYDLYYYDYSTGKTILLLDKKE